MAEPAPFPKPEPDREAPAPDRAAPEARQSGEQDTRAARPAEEHTPETELALPLPEPDESLQAQIDKLQAAAEKSSGHVRNLYLFFLSFSLYLAIIFGGTTHEQLLRAAPVTLPLFDVELPLKGFYLIAPALLVLLHFNLLVQCYLLASKLKRLDDAICGLGSGDRQRIERARLDVFPFTQMLLGDHRSPLARRLPAIMAWVTIVVLPVVLLLFGQASFLPYHDIATTWWHRTLVVIDLVVLWLLWPIATDLGGQWRKRLRSGWQRVRSRALVEAPGRRLPVAAFILGCSRVLDLDRWPATLSRFPGRIWRRYVSNRCRWRPLLLEKLGATIALIAAFLLLAIPGERLAWLIDQFVGERGGLGIISRNLVVRETNLVPRESRPTQAEIGSSGEDLAWRNFGAPPNLSGRDLRYADLSLSNLGSVDISAGR